MVREQKGCYIGTWQLSTGLINVDHEDRFISIRLGTKLIVNIEGVIRISAVKDDDEASETERTRIRALRRGTKPKQRLIKGKA